METECSRNVTVRKIDHCLQFEIGNPYKNEIRQIAKEVEARHRS